MQSWVGVSLMRSAQTGYIKLGWFYKAYNSTSVDLSLNWVRYPCDYCGHKASGKGNLKTHIQSVQKKDYWQWNTLNHFMSLYLCPSPSFIFVIFKPNTRGEITNSFRSCCVGKAGMDYLWGQNTTGELGHNQWRMKGSLKDPSLSNWQPMVVNLRTIGTR